jgi:pimeloyl-ACP methyl ester carboxylesterase
MPRWLVLSVLLLARGYGPACCQTTDSVIWVQGGPYCLKVSTFRGAEVSASPTLVAVLHGDSPFSRPAYQDTFATRVAARYPGVVVAAILRPGYTDPEGHVSEGVRGDATGDNYNATNTDAIAAAIAGLRQRLGPGRVVVVGHSGGAAITGNILGRHPGLIDAALLVSCPCDVERWRAHMYQATHFAGFLGRVATLSPIDLVDSISPRSIIHMVVGEQDSVAPPALSEAYRARAASRGKQVTLVRLQGAGHDILLTPAVLAALGPLLH